MDLLADILSALRLKGTVYFQADFNAPWGMAFSASEVANFHYLVAGGCWLEHDGETPRRLDAGDVIVFPHGGAHRLLCEQHGDALPARDLIEETGRKDAGRLTYGGDGEVTTLICGHFSYDRTLLHPVWGGLPEMLFMRGDDHATEWVATAARMTVSDPGGSGSAALVDRLAETLLIQVIRAHVAAVASPEGFVAALRDGGLRRALEAIHGQPQQAWTLDALARLAGMSRTSFTALFSNSVGKSPMKYLTSWRMQRARDLLRSSQLPLADIANSVGYESEFAFAKAFKRTFGHGPGAARKEMVG